ncbi:MAG: L-seryl-tRNA(Sec) selenium transferase, partial [Verrucomicrobiota bacterium]|nr:L-seryl-tRNA(Sec) selenium transferase [Verrucomicrobiota bacterium]
GECALPRAVVLALVRRRLASLRAQKQAVEMEALLTDLRAAIDDLRLTRFQPVINGTGIIIHTNLGRAPLAPAAIEAMREIASGYSNLEFDLASGTRGARANYLEQNLALVCEAEAATVVNNCAAALVLILRHFTRKKPEVIISRGELIQIGGGFRIPEIMEASGARLREVGTTNRTTLDDYASAIGADTAMILKVHRSNFLMTGFVEAARTEELAQLARSRRIPLVEDLGSGALVALDPPEPTPAETLKRGVDLVCFSGDKLLGGPQAGIIAGKARHVAALKREPFFRALRCDKLVLTALQATIESYLAGTEIDLPVHAMMTMPNEQLRARAQKIVKAVGDARITVGVGKSQVGGGTLPQVTIASVTLELPEARAAALRRRTPPIVGYVERGKLKLDLRTIFPSQDAEIIRALRE